MEGEYDKFWDANAEMPTEEDVKNEMAEDEKQDIKNRDFCERCKVGEKTQHDVCIFCTWSGDPNEEPSLFSETEPEDWRKFAEIHDLLPEDVGLGEIDV